MFWCYKCHREIAATTSFRRHDLCPYCSSALHCCQNCLYYDEFSPKKCSEMAADWVPDKEKANFCEFFEYRQPHIMKKDLETDKARAYWDTLWKKAQ
jgi:hypothetical protein